MGEVAANVAIRFVRKVTNAQGDTGAEICRYASRADISSRSDCIRVDQCMTASCGVSRGLVCVRGDEGDGGGENEESEEIEMKDVLEGTSLRETLCILARAVAYFCLSVCKEAAWRTICTSHTEAGKMSWKM